MCSIAQIHCATWTRNRKVERGHVGRNEAQLKVVFANGNHRCRVRVVQEAADVRQSSSQFILNRRNTHPTSCDRDLTFSWCTSDSFHIINIIAGKQWFPSLSLKNFNLHINFFDNRDWTISIVRYGKSLHLYLTPRKTVVIKPTDVDSLSDPELCPELDVRPRHNFHVNITLTSFPSSKTHILLSSLQNCGPS